MSERINNIVTIDPSLTCTAVTCNGKPIVFAKKELCMSKNESLTKWFRQSCDNGVGIYPTDLSYANEHHYSKLEIIKLYSYNKIVEKIVETIDKIIIPGYHTLFIIEGYSYSSAAGPIIDLVTFGTLLRYKLTSQIGSVVILSPSTIKQESAKLAYDPIKKGKKLEYRNRDGKSGGSFTKIDILKVLLDCDKIEHKWVDYLRSIEDELLNKKSIPKPIEDVNDSLVSYFIAEKICREENFRLVEVLNRLEQFKKS